MNFQSDKKEAFLELFKKTYSRIRNFDGCSFLELYQDVETPDVYYTMSKWENQEKLEAYRNSELFISTWAITKSFFSGPPVAYSLNKEVNDAINPF